MAALGEREHGLIGRGADMATVREALLGHGTGLLLVGEGGVGKSVLAAASVQALEGDFEPTWIHGSQSLSAVPFGALAPLLGRSAATLLDAIRLLRERLDDPGGRPQLIVVDGAHHLDEHSGAILGQLASSGRAKLLAVARLRRRVPEEIRSQVSDRLMARHVVAPMDHNAVGEFCRALLGGPLLATTRDRIHALSGGNPSVARRLVQDGRAAGDLARIEGRWVLLREPVPGREARAWFGGLFATGSAQADEVLEAVALTEPLPLAVLSRVAPAGTIDSLATQGLLEIGSAGAQMVRTAHPFHGAALRNTVPTGRSRRLWDRLAAGCTGEAVHPLALTRRALWSLEAGRTLPDAMLLRAARIANDSLEPARALQLVGGIAEPSVQAEAGLETAVARILDSGDLDSAGSALASARVHSASLPGRKGRWRAALAGAQLTLLGADGDEVPDPDAPGAGLTGADTREEARAESHFARLALAGTAQVAAGDLEAGTRATAEALELTARHRRLRPHAVALATTHVLGLAWAGLLDGAPTADSGGSALPDGAATAATATTADSGGSALLRAGAPPALAGHPALAAAESLARSMSLSDAGDYESALREARDGLAGLAAADPCRLYPLALAQAAWCSAASGARADAADYAVRFGRVLHPGPPMWALLARGMVLAVRHQDGEVGFPAEELARCCDVAGARGWITVRARLLHLRVLLGDDAALADLVDGAAALQGPTPAGWRGLAEGLFARRGETAARDSGAVPGDHWGSHGHGALVFLNRYVEAALSPDQGWVQLLAVLEGEGLAAGHGPAAGGAHAPGAGSDGLGADTAGAGTTRPLLTRREMGIARLVAAGRRNSEISADLQLSTRTVEGHVYRIFGKLGIRRREELTVEYLAARVASHT